jgi:hypothetical protein
MAEKITINRAPVLTLWGAVVAERMGYDAEAALSLGKCLAGLNAQSKGRSLGIYGPAKGPEPGRPKKAGLGEEFWVELCGRPLPARNTEQGVRAVVQDQPIPAEPVRKYLQSKFGEHLEAVRNAMAELAGAFEPDELGQRAYGLYERFRPQVPRGVRGWGVRGELDLDLIRSLARGS